MITHLATDVINNSIRPALAVLARGTDPNDIVEKVVLVPVLPRIVAVHGRRELLVHRLRNNAVRRRLAVVMSAIRAAIERPVANIHATEVAREGTRGERRARPAVASVATAAAAGGLGGR